MGRKELKIRGGNTESGWGLYLISGRIALKNDIKKMILKK
jgi:hypothetical protein